MKQITVAILLFILNTFAYAGSNKQETFEANLFPHPCDVSYNYNHENYIPVNELLGVGRLIHRLYVETDEYKNRQSGKMTNAPKNIIVVTNDLIKKSFAMTGSQAFYNLKIHSAKLSCE